MICVKEIPGHFLPVDGAQEVLSDASIKKMELRYKDRRPSLYLL